MYHIAQVKKESVSVRSADSLRGLKLGPETTWVHKNTKSEGELREIRDFFGFHRLAIEDCVDRQQRPKVEVLEDYVLIIIKDLEVKNDIVVNQLGMFLGKDYLVTISSKDIEGVSSVMEELESGEIKRTRPDSIAYMILDRMVDSYFPVVDGVEEEIEAIERSVAKHPNEKRVAERAFKTRRKLLTLRKATWPARDIFSMLSKGDMPFISKKNEIYYRDVYDHVVLAIDLIETYRELLSGILETHLSSISNSLNEVMKVLTVISTIFIPLTFITGLYGMNFKNMPELYWPYGYFFSLMLMLIIGLGLLFYFKRKQWI